MVPVRIRHNYYFIYLLLYIVGYVNSLRAIPVQDIDCLWLLLLLLLNTWAQLALNLMDEVASPTSKAFGLILQHPKRTTVPSFVYQSPKSLLHIIVFVSSRCALL